MSCAYWWGVYQFVGREVETFQTNEYKTADESLAKAIPTFVDAIHEFEGDPDAFKNDKFASPMTALSMCNIAEIHL
jgi:hypothetical protein